MASDPCQAQVDELRKATDEWVLWSQRSTLGPSLKTVEEVNAPSAIITAEMIRQLDENKKKADEAWLRYIAAIKAISDCRKSNQ